MNEHAVQPGECFASIAKLYGFSDPESLYHHKANGKLKEIRPNMHMLVANDVVFVPEKECKFIDVIPGKNTVLVLKGKVTLLNIVMEDFEGQPLANKTYSLDVAGLTYRGKTGEKGQFTQVIDATATDAKLVVYLDQEQKNALHWPLQIGGLVPLPEIAGIQARLNNLGYHCANETGEIEHTTATAISQFKAKYGLLSNPEVDQMFMNKLIEVYGI